MSRIIKLIGLIFLAVHLFFTHARLLYQVNPEISSKIKDLGFSFGLVNEGFILSLIFALAYSIITIAIILIYSEIWQKYIYMIIVALLDGFGVYIYYNINLGSAIKASGEINQNLFVLFTSFYYASYTFFIVISLGFHKTKRAAKKKERSKIEMKRSIIKPERLETLPERSKKTTERSGTIDDKIKQLHDKGLSQSQIAKEVNLSKTTIHRKLRLIKGTK